MTENHFRSHFSPFQINAQLFFYKMAAGGHCDLHLTFKGNPRSKVTRSTERSYMTLYMCFIQKLVTACTVSEILA